MFPHSDEPFRISERETEGGGNSGESHGKPMSAEGARRKLNLSGKRTECRKAVIGQQTIRFI